MVGSVNSFLRARVSDMLICIFLIYTILQVRGYLEFASLRQFIEALLLRRNHIDRYEQQTTS